MSNSFVIAAIYGNLLGTPSAVLKYLLQFYPPFNFGKIIADVANLSNEAAAAALPSGNNSNICYYFDSFK
jgi:hypothetical protein